MLYKVLIQKFGNHVGLQIFFLLGVSCALIYGLLTNGHNWGGDFAAYIMQARSVLEGNVPQFIEANSFAVQKSTDNLGPITYPWGFPVLLVPFYKAFGMDIRIGTSSLHGVTPTPCYSRHQRLHPPESPPKFLFTSPLHAGLSPNFEA